MSDRKPLAASRRYSAFAEDFLKKAQSFQDPTARAQMLKLADHCDRMAKQAEAAEEKSFAELAN
jgi:spore germination cell wall hydrolase CwlJ-like protein